VSYNLRFPGQYYQAETGLSQNMARDYDPQIGRYIESDPIGLRGGLNTYGYVGSKPVSAIDPTGLAVQWTGSVISFGAAYGIGGQLTRFKLESECKCGRKYRITGFASFLTIGAGAKLAKVGDVLSDASGSGGRATFTDPWSDCPDPNAANGFAWNSGINVVPGVGGTLLGTLNLGWLRSGGYGPDGPSVGFDMSILSTLYGQSAVTSVQRIDCCSR
jgi:RHS repeat-associated protein